MVPLKHHNRVDFIWVFWDSQLVKSINMSKLTGTVLLAHEIQVRFYFLLVIPAEVLIMNMFLFHF